MDVYLSNVTFSQECVDLRKWDAVCQSPLLASLIDTSLNKPDFYHQDPCIIPWEIYVNKHPTVSHDVKESV